MDTYSVKQRIIILFVCVLMTILYGIGRYQYLQNKSMSDKLQSLEDKFGVLSSALQNSNLISEENKQKIQEVANRNANTVTKSQEDVLTATVSKSAPAVVSVVISKDVPNLQVEYVNPFGDNPAYQNIGFKVPVFKQVGTQNKQIGAGTGFIIRENGYILTNRHVVEDTAATYTVLLSNGQKKPATVVYRDSGNDVAIIKIDGSGYSTIPLGNSSTLKLGQTVTAIGNALGQYNNSVSVGIISGLNRTIQAQDNNGTVETLSGVIQTDAAINSGNSGGPLLDLSGNAVGINSAVEQGAQSIGFSIPIDSVKVIVNRVLP